MTLLLNLVFPLGRFNGHTLDQNYSRFNRLLNCMQKPELKKNETKDLTFPESITLMGMEIEPRISIPVFPSSFTESKQQFSLGRPSGLPVIKDNISTTFEWGKTEQRFVKFLFLKCIFADSVPANNPSFPYEEGKKEHFRLIC